MSEHNDNTNVYGRYADAGPTVPADDTVGYAKHALFFHTDGSSIDDAWYINIGTNAAAEFEAVHLVTFS